VRNCLSPIFWRWGTLSLGAHLKHRRICVRRHKWWPDMQILNDLVAKPVASESGRIFTIRIVPDLFTGETLNIGVCVVDHAGKRMVKMVDEPGRLECFYGLDGAENIIFAAKLAAQAALAGQASPSPNIRFEEPQKFFNISPEEGLESFFRDRVTVAIPVRERREAPKGADTPAIRARVYDLMRSKRGLRADEIIPQSVGTVIQTPKGPREVQVPLQARNAFGGLESAAYGVQTVRLHLMDALLDLEAAAAHRSIERLGMFVYRPDNLQEAALLAIDNAIDNVMFRAPSNCNVEIEYSPETLAEKILAWAA